MLPEDSSEEEEEEKEDARESDPPARDGREAESSPAVTGSGEEVD